jgi:hypothetical protein
VAFPIEAEEVGPLKGATSKGGSCQATATGMGLVILQGTRADADLEAVRQTLSPACPFDHVTLLV